MGRHSFTARDQSLTYTETRKAVAYTGARGLGLAFWYRVLLDPAHRRTASKQLSLWTCEIPCAGYSSCHVAMPSPVRWSGPTGWATPWFSALLDSAAVIGLTQPRYAPFSQRQFVRRPAQATYESSALVGLCLVGGKHGEHRLSEARIVVLWEMPLSKEGIATFLLRYSELVCSNFISWNSLSYLDSASSKGVLGKSLYLVLEQRRRRGISQS